MIAGGRAGPDVLSVDCRYDTQILGCVKDLGTDTEQSRVRYSLILLLTLTTVPALAVGGEFDINLNTDAIRVIIAGQLSESKFRVDGGWLYEQDRGDVGHIGLHLVGEASTGKQPVLAGLGGRMLYLNSDVANADGYALALGGFFNYTLTAHNRIGFGGDLYFAPEILSGGDAEGYLEFGAWLGYNILRDATVYVGYRDISADFEQASGVTLDSGLNVGFRLRF